MTVRVFEGDASATIPIVQLAVIEAPRSAAKTKAGLFYTRKDGVEFGIAHVKGVMITSNEEFSSKRSVSVSLTRTGAKCPSFPSGSSPKISAKKRAAASLSRAGTMVWLRTIVTRRPRIYPRWPTLSAFSRSYHQVSGIPRA